MTDTLTAIEAARDAGVTRYAIWRAIRRGRLQAVKRGRDWHIARTEWERYKRETHRPRTKDSPIDSHGEGIAAQESGSGAQQDGQ